MFSENVVAFAGTVTILTISNTITINELVYMRFFIILFSFPTKLTILITTTLAYASSPPLPYVSFNPQLFYALILLYIIMNVNYYLVIRNIDIAYTFH